MKLKVVQENLLNGLTKVCRINLAKTNLAILQNVLLEAKDSFLKLSTTNLEMAIETKVRAKIEREGKITIPSQVFLNFITLLDNSPIEIEQSKEEVIIKSKKNQTKIRAISAEEFPLIPEVEKKLKFQLSGKLFKKALKQVNFAISPTETRLEISGVYLEFNSPTEGKLTLVGTDSYRLAEKTISGIESTTKSKINIIVPIKTFTNIDKIISDEFIEIYPSENQILFVDQDTKVTSRVIVGEYPDYKQIIPRSFLTRVIANKEELIKAIKTAGLFSKVGINDINLKIEKGKLIISSLNTQIGETKLELDADIKGENNEIAFNYRYLLDGILNMPGEEIELKIIDQNSPVMITSPADKDYLYLVMPIKK